MLKPTLACLFAVTTPAGILLGILLFGHNNDIGTCSDDHCILDPSPRSRILALSAPTFYPRHHVRHLGRHAHVRCLRRDARRRFRDGSDPMAEQRMETDTRTVQFGGGRHHHGAGGILDPPSRIRRLRRLVVWTSLVYSSFFLVIIGILVDQQRYITRRTWSGRPSDRPICIYLDFARKGTRYKRAVRLLYPSGQGNKDTGEKKQ